MTNFALCSGDNVARNDQGRREHFALKAAPGLRRFVEKLHDRRLVRVGFGELGPGIVHQRLDRLAHLLHMRAHGLGISLEGLPLLRIERELRPDPLQPLHRVRRQSGTMNADPQGTGDKAQIERQG